MPHLQVPTTRAGPIHYLQHEILYRPLGILTLQGHGVVRTHSSRKQVIFGEVLVNSRFSAGLRRLKYCCLVDRMLLDEKLFSGTWHILHSFLMRCARMETLTLEIPDSFLEICGFQYLFTKHYSKQL